MKNARDMVFASFIGDSLALGVHWIYNVKAIEKRVGQIDDLIEPVVKTFHPNRAAGEFTHYGDQMLLLLEFCAKHCRPSAGAEGQDTAFPQSAFLRRWAAYMEEYDGYMDHASKDTLAAYRKLSAEERSKAGDTAGSQMDDLSGAGRIAPVLYFYRDRPETAVDAARAQAAVTHNDESVLDCAAFLAELTLRSLKGASPVETARNLIEGKYSGGTIEEPAAKGLDSAGKDTTETIAEFGQACSVQKGLPSVMHLIASYEDDLKEALVAGTMAGGDSAARNHVVGMVLGAYTGLDGIPKKWLEAMKAGEQIQSLLA
jgi:ADP-ribosylglycohydrolase